MALSSIRDGLAGARNGIEQATNETHLRIGVTGLSRSGKTVFIISAIQNMMAMASHPESLPALAAAMAGTAGNRLIDVRLEPPGVQNIPWFDVREMARQLGGAAPRWPERTADLSKLALRLTLRRRSRAAGRILGHRRVTMEFLDYPGEWLLDLPMLQQDFATWSHATMERLRGAGREAAMRPFLDFLAARPNWAPADEETARQGFTLYRDGLLRCRDEFGFRFLQPGRFLRPGIFGESPLMWFFPFVQGGAPPAGSLGALLAERFEAYKADVRERFIAPYFSRFDRNLVLVDVLGALRGGRDATYDTQAALEAIAQACQAEAPRWRPGSSLKKVLFVATKADHVPIERRTGLRDLLVRLCAGAEAPMGRLSPHVAYHLAASIRCTRSGVHTVGGSRDAVVGNRELPVVIGTLLGEERERPWYCGEIPSALPAPDSDFWTRPLLQLPQFRPPAFDALAREGIPHIGLDVVLADLIGDLL